MGHVIRTIYMCEIVCACFCVCDDCEGFVRATV